MKYIKTYKKLKIVDFSELDNLVNKIKNKFGDELEKEFSKYLTPQIIELGNKKVKAFLLNPEFGTTYNIDFNYSPHKIIANICFIFKENGKWKRSSYIKIVDGYINISEFVKKYVANLKVKYIKREERRLKNDINKYNL